MYRTLALLGCIFMVGCDSSSTVSLSPNKIKVVAKRYSIDPCYMMSLADQALKNIAEETVKRGYDNFVVTGGDWARSGWAPCQYEMKADIYKNGDPAGKRGISARDWLKKYRSKSA